MTITLQTPILGPMDASLVRFIDRFKGGAYDDATVDRFGAALTARSPEFGIRASIVAAQIAKETGWFRFGGQVQPGQFNLAGLGATNGGAAGMSYPDIQTGVAAVFAHHLVYIYGARQNWPGALQHYSSLDLRYDAVLSTGRAGSVRVIGDYTNGNWAYSPQFPVGSLANGYAAGIASIADGMTTNGGATVADFPTMADLGFAVRLEPQRLGYFGADRSLADISWWVQHDTEGHYEGDISTLTRTKAGSVHFIIGREWGQLTASVPIRTTAWTPGNDDVAAASVNVEMSGFADARDGGYTDWQYFCNGALFRWCVSAGMVNVPAVYIGKIDANGGPEPDVPGILGHQDVPDGNGGWGGAYHHTDPGPHWDWNRMIAEIGAPPAPPVPVGAHTVDGLPLGEGFFNLLRDLDGPNDARMRSLGLLLESDHDEWLRRADGSVIPVVVARFERDAMLWDRGQTPPPWDVRMPLATETLLRRAPVAVRHLIAPTRGMRGKGPA
jgi:hypothetical protein